MLRSVRLFSVVLALGAIAYAGEAKAAGRLAAFRAARVAAIEAAFQANDAAPESYAAPAPAADAAPAAGAPMAGPVGGSCCCPTPCITYRHRGHHSVCCGCAPSYETVLCATNPRTCCPVNIPVCVPGCCTGAPTMTCHHNTVRYDWCCGYRVTVRFKHNGDVVVVSRG